MSRLRPHTALIQRPTHTPFCAGHFGVVAREKELLDQVLGDKISDEINIVWRQVVQG